MTCNLEKNKGVSVKSLPLGGEGASLQFVTLAGSEPGQLAEHAELLQKAEKNGLRWIGPEVYGSADLDTSKVPGAGMNMPSMPFWAVCRPVTGQPDEPSRHWMYSGRWKKR